MLIDINLKWEIVLNNSKHESVFLLLHLTLEKLRSQTRQTDFKSIASSNLIKTFKSG